jgi:hypothetical protein
VRHKYIFTVMAATFSIATPTYAEAHDIFFSINIYGQSKPGTYHQVYEKNISRIVVGEEGFTLEVKEVVRADVIRFIKINHPSYFQGYYNAFTSNEQSERDIHSSVSVQGPFDTEEYAKNGLRATEAGETMPFSEDFDYIYKP